MKRIYLKGLVVAMVFLCACRGNTSVEEQAAYTIKNDTVYLHAAELIMSKVKLGGVVIDSVAKEVVTSGTVQPIPTQFAYIAPPFSGRVSKSHIHFGQKVRSGTPLFEIISPEFTSMQKEYYQALAERDMARKDLLRKDELINNMLCSQKEYEEAENAMKQADKEYENARAALEVYHVDIENMVFGQPLTIYSPISGEILEDNVVTGLYLNSDTDPIAVVADLNKVWVTAQVKEKDIRFINEGDKMTIHVDAYPGRSIEGTVYHIDEAVDEDTRSIKVISICDNISEGLKLGMYATVHFYGKPESFFVLPDKSVMQGEKSSYVLAQIRQGEAFVRKDVDIAFTKHGNAYISQGITESDIVVSEGGYYFQ